MQKIRYTLSLVSLAVLIISGCGPDTNTTSSEVMYFILIDRFVDGDPSNNTGGLPESYKPYDGTDPEALKHYQGGDLAGITQNLRMLQEMGITMVWISPFLNNSDRDYVGWWPYHGYHPIDFYAVDEHFGTLEDVKKLVQTAHDLDMKIIFDMPFNQTSPDHPWLKDPEKRDRFHWDEDGKPLEITDWFNQEQIENGELHGLPDLAQEHPAVREYLLDVSKFWIEETGCDGFRLDAVKHIPIDFWREFNAEIKAFAGGDFLLMGEVFWGEADRITPYRNLGFDILFDIPGYYAIQNTFSKGSSMEIFSAAYWDTEKKLGEVGLATLIDNHDVARFSAGLGDQAWQKQLLALSWLMTRPGLPVIYYGTELGMPGYPVVDAQGNPQDYLNRLPYPPAISEDELKRKQQFSELTQLRADHPVLANGSFHEIYRDWSIYGFARSDQDETLIVVLNSASTVEFVAFPVPEGLEEEELTTVYGEAVLRTEHGEWWFKLPPLSLNIWSLKTELPPGMSQQVSFTDRLSGDYRSISLYLLDAEERVKKLSVAGDFNNWTPGDYQNNRSGDTLKVTFPIKPGTYHYKLVLDGTRWIADPNAAESVLDPYGGQNSVLKLDPDEGC